MHLRTGLGVLKRLLITLGLCLATSIVAVPSFGVSSLVDTAEAGMNGSEAEKTLSNKQLDQLIKILGDKEQREQFIRNLEGLRQAQAEVSSENPLAIADTTLPEEAASRLVDKYGEVLDGMGISANNAIKFSVTFGMLFFLTIMSLLVVLSEIGVDVMPLLAGAGVLRIAIGFGAQTLAKDFLAGFTILIEDLL